MALAELHNAESEAVSRKMFYRQFVDVIRDAVSDTILRQKIFYGYKENFFRIF